MFNIDSWKHEADIVADVLRRAPSFDREFRIPKEEFIARLKGLTDALLDNPKIFGFCYTQLTNVEQEQNGLYTYDRKPKFPPEVIRPIFSRKAAIED